MYLDTGICGYCGRGVGKVDEGPWEDDTGDSYCYSESSPWHNHGALTDYRRHTHHAS